MIVFLLLDFITAETNLLMKSSLFSQSIILSVFLLLSCGTESTPESIYLDENGITIKCPNSNIGDTGIVNGIKYEVVDRNILYKRLDGGLDVSKLCVSLIVDMSKMFLNYRDFNQPIENWDVSNVINMDRMFLFSQFNQPIGNWDVSSVKNMRGMFSKSNFNQPIGDWDVSSVTEMSEMFYRSRFNQPIGDWDVSNVTNMEWMFMASQFDQPIGDWDVSSVTDMSGMFRESQFNQPIGNWDVGNVTNMFGMFWDSRFNQNISDWCVRKIGSEPGEFSTNSPLTQQNKPVWGTCPD